MVGTVTPPDIVEITEDKVREILATEAGHPAASACLEFAERQRAAGEEVHFFTCGPYLWAASKPKTGGTP